MDLYVNVNVDVNVGEGLSGLTSVSKIIESPN